MGRNRLIETALRFELWTELTALDGTMYLGTADDPADEIKRLRTLAVAYFSRNDKARGQDYVKRLETELENARTARFAAADEAESAAKQAKKSPDDTTKAMAEALQRASRRIDGAESALAEARLYQALAAADAPKVRELLPAAKDLSLERKARILLQTGDKPGAETAARDAVKNGEGQVLPLAIQSDLLWRIGKKKEAVDSFLKLRELAAQVDMDVNVFARLAAVAREAGYPRDWRPKTSTANDAGVRPPLDQLGPFRWHPYVAPQWSLPDDTGRRLSLDDFRKKPVLVMFYLGSGCSHCIEQLNHFAPVAKAYADAGISMIAISTDSADALHETFAKAKDADGFPFPIVADPTLATFKTYRAFDDFEKIPLHGTFLIDGAGFVRWQDISYEPFRNAQWLLAESRRLLAMPVTSAGGTARALPAADSSKAAASE
jgi:peroxiredoxin